MVKRKEMSDHIPPEVLSDILSKLSIEDIVRCTAVCKSWYSLITSPAFLSLHTQFLAKKKEKNSLLLVRNYISDSQLQIIDENYSVHLDDDTFSEYESFDFSFESSKPDYRIVDCLNGVVCLTKSINTRVVDIILWNPSIRKYIRLPNPIVSSGSKDFTICAIGFGFDESTNDFMVVRVIDNWGRESGVLPHAEVYKLSEGCWRNINPVGLCDVIIPQFCNQGFLHGAVHWIGRKRRDVNDLTIVSFDIQNEVFDVMTAPDCLADRLLPWRVHVSVMGDSLSVIYRKKHGAYNEMICVCGMKQYGVADSWTQQFSIGPSPEGCFWRILCFPRNGQALLARRSARALYSYDPNTNRFKELKLFRSRSFEVVDFVESLALLGVKSNMG